MRLIDADALIQLLCVNMDTGQQFHRATHCVDVMPTVDAVPVIHCKDCGARMDGDPNGFNDETVQALKDATEGKNLSKVYETLDDMYADMDGSEWREYIYRVRETADGVESDRMGELIRCKDCKHYQADDDGIYCDTLGIFGTSPTSYCSFAKRRDDETD